MSELFASYLHSYKESCFQEHIRESIALNKKIRPLYRKLSGGRSEKIFQLLISSEYTTLIPAAWYDFKARSFQKAGSTLLQHEFLSMIDPGNLRDLTPPGYAPKDISWKSLHADLTQSLKIQDESELRSLCLSALRDLEGQKHYSAMVRHLLESIYRFAFFLPLREEECSSLGVNSPREIIFSMMKLHLLGFPGCIQIDRWCLTLQAEGIPILTSELPDLLVDLGGLNP